ncbi:hypothetical protein ACFPRL_27145 [Pseudoclavibacter helvolus]
MHRPRLPQVSGVDRHSRVRLAQHVLGALVQPRHGTRPHRLSGAVTFPLQRHDASTTRELGTCARAAAGTPRTLR